MVRPWRCEPRQAADRVDSDSRALTAWAEELHCCPFGFSFPRRGRSWRHDYSILHEALPEASCKTLLHFIRRPLWAAIQSLISFSALYTTALCPRLKSFRSWCIPLQIRRLSLTTWSPATDRRSKTCVRLAKDDVTAPGNLQETHPVRPEDHIHQKTTAAI